MANLCLKLYVAFSSACAMLVISTSLIYTARHTEYHVGLDTSGVLQVAWLLGNEPHLAKVEEPNLEALRVAGMYEVDPMGLRMRRANTSSLHEADDNVEDKQTNNDEQYLYQADSQGPPNFVNSDRA